MARTRNLAALLPLAALLAGCGGGPSTGAGPTVSQGPTTIIPDRSPVQLYTDLARLVNTCWLNPARPVLPNHESRADAPAGAAAGAVHLGIWEKLPDGKRGLKAFSISFEPRGKGTVINAENHKLPYPVGQKLVADVGYWAQGGQGCDAAPASTSPPAGSTAPRRGFF